MTETIAGRRRLGRGLEALLGPTREEAEREGSLVELAIADIRPNPYQPRRDVDPAALDELQASIRKAGLLQPVVVRPVPGNNGGFELIAGERRLRACQALGWERIPAVKREVDDRTLLTLALVENLQRDDLSPVDEARGYERLIAEFSLTQQDVADAVGGDSARQGSSGPRALGARVGGPGARRARPGPASAPQEGNGASARGAPHRGRAAPPPRHRRAVHAPRQGQGTDPSQLRFKR